MDTNSPQNIEEEKESKFIAESPMPVQKVG